MDDVSTSIGRVLRARRKALGMSQSQVAEITGKKQSQIARIEGGHSDSRLSSLVDVSRSLGVELLAVPIQFLPAVKHFLSSLQTGVSTQTSRLVGNDPEDAEDEDEL